MNSTYRTAYFQGFFQAYGRDKEAQDPAPPQQTPAPPPEIPLRERQQHWDDMHNAARTEAAAGVNPREAQRYIKNLPKRRPTSTDFNWESPLVRTAADWFGGEEGKFISQELRSPEGWREKAVNNLYDSRRGWMTPREDRFWGDNALFKFYRNELYATNPAFRDEVHTIAEPVVKRRVKDFAVKAAPYAAIAAVLGGGAALMAGGQNKSTAGVPSSPSTYNSSSPSTYNSSSPSTRDPRIDSLKDWFIKKDRPGVSPDRPRVTTTWDPMDTYRRSDG